LWTHRGGRIGQLSVTGAGAAFWHDDPCAAGHGRICGQSVQFHLGLSLSRTKGTVGRAYGDLSNYIGLSAELPSPRHAEIKPLCSDLPRRSHLIRSSRPVGLAYLGPSPTACIWREVCPRPTSRTRGGQWNPPCDMSKVSLTLGMRRIPPAHTSSVPPTTTRTTAVKKDGACSECARDKPPRALREPRTC